MPTYNASFLGRGAPMNATFGTIQRIVEKDYNELINKPTINGVELSGNKTSADLGIGGGGTEDYEALNNQPLIEGVKVIGSKNAEDYNLASRTYVDTNIGNIEVLLSTI